jgi:hypothetical protein
MLGQLSFAIAPCLNPTAIKFMICSVVSICGDDARTVFLVNRRRSPEYLCSRDTCRNNSNCRVAETQNRLPEHKLLDIGCRAFLGGLPSSRLAGCHPETRAPSPLFMRWVLVGSGGRSFFLGTLGADALMLLDDYAYRGHRPQKVAMDRFAQTRANKILSLPTGQGLLIKPAHLH